MFQKGRDKFTRKFKGIPNITAKTVWDIPKQQGGMQVEMSTLTALIPDS